MNKSTTIVIAVLFSAFLSSCTTYVYEVKPPPRRVVYSEPVRKAPASSGSDTSEGFRAVERPSTYSGY